MQSQDGDDQSASLSSSGFFVFREELAEGLANLIRTFEIGEVAAVGQHDEAGPRDYLGDVGRAGDRHEIVVAVQDQRWDAQPCDLGQQIVLWRLGCLFPEFARSLSCDVNALLRPAFVQARRQAVE